MPADSIHHFEIDKSTDQSNWSPVVNPVPGGGAARAYDTTLLPGLTYYRNTGVTTNGIRFPYNVVSVNATTPGAFLRVWSFGNTTSGQHTYAQVMAIDPVSREITVAGKADGNVNFGGSTLGGAGNYTYLFVARYTAAGAHLWSHEYPAGDAYFTGMVIHPTDHWIAACGRVSAAVNFGPNPGDNMPGLGSADIFIVQFTSAGAFLRSKRFGGTEFDSARGLAIGPDGHLVLVGDWGMFSTANGTTINFGGDGLVHTVGDFSSDAFAVKLNGTNLAHIWSKSFGGVGIDTIKSVGIGPDGHPVVCGGFQNSINFGGSTSPLTSNGNKTLFLAKLNGDTGLGIWANKYGGYVEDTARSVAVDSNGKIAFTGTFGLQINLGGSTLSGVGNDWFLAKYSSSGAHLWSRNYAKGSDSFGSWFEHVSFDSAGQLLACGLLAIYTSLGGDDDNLPGIGQDIVIVKYSASDVSPVHLWSRRFRQGDSNDQGNVVLPNGPMEVVLAAQFNGTVNFDTPTTNPSATKTSTGGYDSAIAVYAP